MLRAVSQMRITLLGLLLQPVREPSETSSMSATDKSKEMVFFIFFLLEKCNYTSYYAVKKFTVIKIAGSFACKRLLNVV